MAFPEEVKKAAYNRAGGKCECTRSGCNHSGRCNASLSGGWHAHHIHASSLDGHDGLSNCEALCIPCHKNTQSYGRA
jgi:5-methylcytosine-specific restriction endonuclease McrA